MKEMLIRLMPNQVPMLWDAIKFSVVMVNRISEHDRPLYFNKLLHALLSNKAQCFARLNDERKLLAIIITRIISDEVTGDKTLFLECLYSFEGVSEEQWRVDRDVVKRFAAQQKCKRISTYSNNERVFEIAKAIGFEERFRCFILEV